MTLRGHFKDLKAIFENIFGIFLCFLEYEAIAEHLYPDTQDLIFEDLTPGVSPYLINLRFHTELKI